MIFDHFDAFYAFFIIFDEKGYLHKNLQKYPTHSPPIELCATLGEYILFSLKGCFKKFTYLNRLFIS